MIVESREIGILQSTEIVIAGIASAEIESESGNGIWMMIGEIRGRSHGSLFDSCSFHLEGDLNILN